MLVNENIKMALSSLRTARWRSFLTMLGIIIGVASVVTIVSLGEGVRRQVSTRIDSQGKDLITVRPGNRPKSTNNVLSMGPMGGRPGGSLTETDTEMVRLTDGVKYAVPFGIVNGIAEAEDIQADQAIILAVNENLPDVLNHKVEFGSFFSKGDARRHVAVIGKTVAEQLFKENVPTGRTFKVRDQEFIVGGILEKFQDDPLNPGVDYNLAIFIPYTAAKQIDGNAPPIFQILARANDEHKVDRTVSSVNKNLRAAHGNQQDFAVLNAQDSLTATATLMNLITQLIGGIAAISLLVGGIGIMNIMLVSVSERTQEIGVRKALGATNHQILGQFLVEASVLSFVGGLIGVATSLLANLLLRLFTNLEPVITWPIMVIATGVALAVGILFGLMPAARAAHKDPIDALRN